MPTEEKLRTMASASTDDQKNQIDTIAARWKTSLHKFVASDKEPDWTGQIVCKGCGAPEVDIRHERAL